MRPINKVIPFIVNEKKKKDLNDDSFQPLKHSNSTRCRQAIPRHHHHRPRSVSIVAVFNFFPPFLFFIFIFIFFFFFFFFIEASMRRETPLRMVPLWLRLASILLLLDARAASLNDEGMALLRIKEGIELDPYGALANWVDDGGGDGLDPCSWFGVGCSRHRRVVALNLKDLALRGTLSSNLGDLVDMKYLTIHNNSFYGICPREIAKLQKLVILDLGLNNLSGSPPPELDSIKSLEILILGGNKLMVNLSPRLQEVNALSKMQIDEGVLAPHEGSIRMNVRDAAIRRLLKDVDQGIGRHQEIKIFTWPFVPSSSPSHSPSPMGQGLQSLPHAPAASPAHSPAMLLSSASSPQQASDLPGIVAALPLRRVPERPDPANTSVVSSLRKGSDAKQKISWIIYPSIAGGIAVLLSVFLLYILCWRANKVVTVRPWATGLSGQLQKAFVSGVPALKRAEIQIACEDFSNIVGTSPDCTLYKGTLSSGVEIAVTSTLVTSAKDWSKQHETQFRSKIAMLSRVNHKNFANLLGYCEENEPFTRMMVFEYAPNGTLFEHLHVMEAEHLDWPTRLRIAMGVAYCLEHMDQLSPPVVLRNLDSSSIHITDDCAAKVSDTRFWADAKEPELMSTLSPGAPIDPSSDDRADVVYKFGVLLLELISGRLPYAEDEGLLVLWAWSFLTGRRLLKGIVDPTLESYQQEELVALCNLILSCTAFVAERPTMAEVALRLREITAMSPDGAFPKHSPLWWAELEIISSADA